MQAIFSKTFSAYKPRILEAVEHFNEEGKLIYSGRNKVKSFETGNFIFNIKAFKKPNFINKIAYKYFRKSKAQRSFEYAQLLSQKGVGTPAPIAYMEEDGFLFGESYYVCEQVDYDFMFKDLVTLKDISKRNEILKQFVAFTHAMHEKGIEFLDHSQGNTLIVDKGNDVYEFYLVDLNRMKFHATMSLDQRIYNFRKLTSGKEIIEVMSRYYAALTSHNFEEVFNKMWQATVDFQDQFNRKKQMKKKIKFWKKG